MDPATAAAAHLLDTAKAMNAAQYGFR